MTSMRFCCMAEQPLLAGGAEGTNASQFYITTGLELDSLDGKHTIFGEVSEGLDVLQQINDTFVDDAGRPLQNIRSVLFAVHSLY